MISIAGYSALRGDIMANIKTKQFQVFTDMNMVWDFLVDIYDRNGGGVPAPFFEYAMSSSWHDARLVI